MFKFLVLTLWTIVVGLFIFVFLSNSDLKPEVKVVTKVVTNPGIPFSVKVFHDDKRGVTCYHVEHTSSSALSCLPDTQLRFKL